MLGLVDMATWGVSELKPWFVSTVVLAVVALAVGLVIPPVNDATFARRTRQLAWVASSLGVVARMIGIVVGLAFLTVIVLHCVDNEM